MACNTGRIPFNRNTHGRYHATAAAAAHRQETSMRKLILLIGVIFALAAGTVMTIYFQPAVADCIGGGCSP
jgi:hypothetical protein